MSIFSYMKELAAAENAEPKKVSEDDIPPIDLQSLVEGIAALDRFDSVLADYERSLGPVDDAAQASE